MKKVVLPLKICLILLIGVTIPLSLFMFPALLFGSSNNLEILQIGYGYLTLFILSCIGLYILVRKEL